MRVGGRVGLAVLVAGCGRLGFGETATGDGGRDAARDGASETDVMLDGPGVDAFVACPGFALLCDDFESGNFNKWSFTDTNLAGTIAATTTRPHGGTHGLEVTMPVQANDAARDLVLRLPTQTTGTIAIKAWASFPQRLQAFNLIFTLRNKASQQYATLGGDNGISGNPPHWVASDNTIGDQPSDHHALVEVPPLDTWVCVEYVFDFSPPRIRAYVDESLVLDATPVDPAPAYTDIGVGVPRADGAGFHVFLDDVVIAHQRVGCP